ncbi:DMT family transporter [Tatumella saanichensis]|uniref:DMT family transporter n=1 Tax=Tatumella saanichensis TaxID=480813 RepID=UPI0004A4D096|nr:DMT family transporter [Tatumella saanichensis]
MTFLLYFAVVLIWGTTWIAIFVQQHSANVAVETAVFWRFFFASLLLLVILKGVSRLRRLPAATHTLCLIQGSCIFGANFLCFYTAAQWVNSGLESVIFSMAVLYNALNSRLFFGQKPAPRFVPALILGLTGMVILFWPQLQENHFSLNLLYGVGLCALGTYGFSLGNMIGIHHQQQQQDALSTTAWAMLYGSLIMAVIALLRGASLAPSLNLPWLTAVVYLAVIGSVCGFGAYFILLVRIGAAKASWSTLLFPLVALALSARYEGFVWQLTTVIGLLCIGCSNLLMFLPQPPRQR